MEEAKKYPDTTETQHPPYHSIEQREAIIPRGWKYNSIKLGRVIVPWYASPESQLILVSFVCFLCPGMFNALNGLGGSGLLGEDAKASDASNMALYATFAVVGFFAGSVVNSMGIRASLAFGGLGYCVYVSSFLYYQHHRYHYGYVIFAGIFLGCCAGILWAAQGAIMMSYPTEQKKGRFISWFWIIFNLGGVMGGLFSFGLNHDIAKDKANSASDATYIGFIVLTFLGACLSWTLVDAKHVVRRDGSRIILMKHPTWKTEIFGLWETLRSDPYIVFLFPMFFASNWFYTYQFNDVNLARFNLRTRALNNTLYWLAQIGGSLLFGFALDYPNIRRTTRAKVAWVVMFILTLSIWGGGFVFQRGYDREGVAVFDKNGDKKTPIINYIDYQGPGWVGPMFLYVFYGFYDAAWQTCVYWFMGAITNNSRKLANFAGFYKGIQSAGAAIVFRLDWLEVPYMSMFASSWILLAVSLVLALPVLLFKIRNTVPIEEDLKFSDETIEDVIARRVGYDSVEMQKA